MRFQVKDWFDLHHWHRGRPYLLAVVCKSANRWQYSYAVHGHCTVSGPGEPWPLQLRACREKFGPRPIFKIFSLDQIRVDQEKKEVTSFFSWSTRIWTSEKILKIGRGPNFSLHAPKAPPLTVAIAKGSPCALHGQERGFGRLWTEFDTVQISGTGSRWGHAFLPPFRSWTCKNPLVFIGSIFLS